MTLVALSALLTGLSLYDNIAKHAGAGTLVPITGFANAIAAPAVEFNRGVCFGSWREDVYHRRTCYRVWCIGIRSVRHNLLDLDSDIKSRP